jgi:hypothetical protein
MRTITYREALDHVMLRDVIFSIFENEQDDADWVRRIALALKPSGRCLFEVYNKQFAKSHGIQGSHFHDKRSDRFLAKDPSASIKSWKLYSREQWQNMLGANGLKIVSTSGWKWNQDPDPPPWRADYIVARKGAS